MILSQDDAKEKARLMSRCVVFILGFSVLFVHNS